MKTVSPPFLLFPLASMALANTAPEVVIQSAEMRADSTLMDVVYRVNDPDDATVKTRALAFVDGVRSFANVIRPVTFLDGTDANLGEAVAANVDHTLTWDVGADWDIDLGQIKFEVLAMDGRGLLPIDWITIPGAGGKPELTISLNSPADAEVLDALFWRYAEGDPGLTLASGSLAGTAASGVFDSMQLADGGVVGAYAIPYLLKLMDLQPAGAGEVAHASAARSGIQQPGKWHAVNRPWEGISPIITWGNPMELAAGATDVIQIDASGGHFLALNHDGGVVGSPWPEPPAGLSDVIMVAAGTSHGLALKSDGTVVGWGDNGYGQATPPEGLSGVLAVAAGYNFSLALMSDGTVIGWGENGFGQATAPTDLTDAIAIAAGQNHSLALRSNGTVVGWGGSGLPHFNPAIPPAGLGSVSSIAAGLLASLALKDDGTVVAWGLNQGDILNPPPGLAGVTAIAAGGNGNRGYLLAVKGDGSVAGWGQEVPGVDMTPPSDLTGVTAVAIGTGRAAAVLPKMP